MRRCDVCEAPIRWRKVMGRWVAFTQSVEHKCPGRRPAPQPVRASAWQPKADAQKVALSRRTYLGIPIEYEEALDAPRQA